MSEPEPKTVGGRYQLGELLGRGGMAEVREGTDTRLGRTVAIKRLRTDLASDATFQARFRREAQSAASLNHPSIVAVYDTGEEMSTDGSHVAQPYIVMEYVAGRTLRDVLREGRKILPERALEITSDVLGALDYSHRAGIIHRDIKPGNVMLTPSGDVKVMDFGIARAISDASSTMTQTAAVVGTAQYLSPEQARGETVDNRSDVYSAGCLLYELLTGRPPFIGDNPISVAYQHVREQPVPPSHLDEELDPALDHIVLKSLSKRVDERYQSAAAMKTDIDRYLAGHQVVAPPPPPPPAGRDDRTRVVPGAAVPAAAAARPLPPQDYVEAYDDEDRDRSSAGMWVVIGLLLIALLGGGYYVFNKMFEPTNNDVAVPSLIGKTRAEARQLLVDANLSIGQETYEFSTDYPKDTVIDQSEPQDTYVAPGTPISLTLSQGKPLVEVPALVGSTKEDARQQLQGLNLKFKLVEEESDEPAGRVLSTDPVAGTQVPEGKVVVVKFSDGPEQVPNVVGMTKAEAMAAIKAAGFVPDAVDWSNTTEPKGTVVRQSQTAGSTLAKGSTVTIFISTYEEPTPTPTPTPSDTPTDVPTDLPTAVPTDLPTETAPVEPGT